ncbi:polyprenyl diphosphate synthase [Roseisolibacter sp. H3M3-2]|uniref:polyprenyl diphosphate synthase n=1 Tax=Roseisolibacter sp. H3M3-2 TaxID=3031323 RepID=UPI0023DAA547|nr:polyprenyl diphosphate synthase [Roseisolibacter sp. H3M3-2]MDF1504432.1 polyprenyl diphosphate synthase [Roseisolibacter sp. H3M3-2]
MSQSASQSPLHVAIVMDGNGRWAARRGRPGAVVHLAGARAARGVVDAAAREGVGGLTLYAFSADNWRRPDDEVRALMRLFRRYLHGEAARCVANGVRLTVIGRRDRLDPALLHAIAGAESATAGRTRLHLRIALDYSARDALVAAAALPPTALADPRADLAARLGTVLHDAGPVSDVDLLIRTGGERRLSDFLLWESAYAELWFTPTMWPDFDADELRRALADFAARERRFGALPAASTAAPAAHG